MRFFSKRRPPGRPAHPDIFTPAEWRVLEQLRAGRTNQQIADSLGMSHNTVKTHVSNMLAKLGVGHRHELANWSGAPAEASQVVLRRLSLAVPWPGRITAAGGAVVAGALFIVAMQSMIQSGSPTGASEILPIATATEAPTEERPESTRTTTIGDPGTFPTGLAAVDETVDLVIHGDVEALVARMAFEEAVCGSGDRPSYEVRCEDLGLPPGSTFVGLPMGGCDVGRVPVESVTTVLRSMLEVTGTLQLWSMFEPTQRAVVTPSTLALTFAAFNADGSGQLRPVLQVSMRDDAIVGVFRTSCIDDVPAPGLVNKWLVHPTDLGHTVRVVTP